MSRALVPGNKGLGLRSFRPPRKKSADLGSSRCEVDIKRVYDAVIRPGNLSNAGLILPTCRLFRLSLSPTDWQASITCEVVGSQRAAQIGPALGAPVIDEAGFANERLEPLGFAHCGVRG